MEQLLATLRAEMPHLVERFGVRSLALFGSYVRGDATDLSDVDILVEFQAGHKTFDSFMDTCLLLEDILGRTVEVVTPDGLSPHLKPHIFKELVHVSMPD